MVTSSATSPPPTTCDSGGSVAGLLPETKRGGRYTGAGACAWRMPAVMTSIAAESPPDIQPCRLAMFRVYPRQRLAEPVKVKILRSQNCAVDGPETLAPDIGRMLQTEWTTAPRRRDLCGTGDPRRTAPD